MTVRTRAISRRGVPAPRADDAELSSLASSPPPATNALQQLIAAHRAHADGHLSRGELQRRTTEILASL